MAPSRRIGLQRLSARTDYKGDGALAVAIIRRSDRPNALVGVLVPRQNDVHAGPDQLIPEPIHLACIVMPGAGGVPGLMPCGEGAGIRVRGQI